MDAKKVRNAGIVSVLSLAVALGAGIGSSMSAGAQSQTYVGNDKPDGRHPIVSSIKGNSVTLATGEYTTREVQIDASTVVVKDGKFAGVSALKVGDKIQVDPRITLPNGLEGHGTGSTGNSNSSQEGSDPANPDKSGESNNNGDRPGQPDANGGSTAPSAPQAPVDPNNKDNSVPTNSGQLPGEGNAPASSSTVSVIWVTSNDDKLLGGVVHWAQGDTVILNIPGVGYSEYVIHTTNNTGYQQMLSAGATPATANAADMKVGSSVVILGSDGGSNNEGFFTAKAILVLPASGKLR